MKVRVLAARLELETPSPVGAVRLLDFARGDDGREFFMANLNRYRAEPRYADGRGTGGTSSEEVDFRYARKMLPRLLASGRQAARSTRASP